MKTITEHRSIRKFKNKKIEDNKLDLIYRAIAMASNTGNMQLYSVIATTAQNIKDALCEQAHFNQQMVKQAPLVLTFCADLNRFNKWCTLRNANPGYDNFLSFYTASIDSVIAAQNACIAAEEQGLGICYLGTTNYNAHKIIEILSIPKNVVPVTTIVIGYPDETPPQTERLPLQAIIHKDIYNDYSDDDINNLHYEKENLTANKKFVEENKTENLAQIFTNKRYTKENNVYFSKLLLDIIEKQGFNNNKT